MFGITSKPVMQVDSVKWLIGIIAVMGSLTIGSASCASSGPSFGCVAGRLVVTPRIAHAGATVTVRSEAGGCQATYPVKLIGPEVALPSRAAVYQTVGVTRPRRGDGSFVLSIRLPDVMPPGLYEFQVYAPYPECPDNASCAGLQGDFRIST